MTLYKTTIFHKAGEGSGGGGDQHNLGWYATQSALETAHPTAENGDWAIVGSTDTVWVWDSDTTAWVDTDTKGQVTSVNNKTGDVTLGANDVLPSQTGNSGKFLTTDGTDASWSDKPLVNAATGVGSVGIGNSIVATQGNSVVIGDAATTGNAASGKVAIGNGSRATGNGATAVGQGSVSSGLECIAIGQGATASANGAVQIKYGTNSTANTLQVGSYQLMSADGTIPTDRLVHAINKYSTMPTAGSTNEGWIVQFTGTTDSTYTHGHLYECVSDGQDPATYSWTEVQLGGGGSSYTAGTGIDITGGVISVTSPTLTNTATGTNSLTILGTSSNTNENSINIGVGSSISSTGSYDKKTTIIGVNSQGNTRSVSIGYNAISASDSVVIGASASCNTSYQVVIGGSVNSMGNSAVCIGYNSNCSGAGATVIGSGAAVTQNCGLAIGKDAIVSAVSGIQINASGITATNNNANTFKVANANGNFEIMSADGTIPAARHASLPATDGTYVLKCVISNGVPTLSWVVE